jgi:hypothetical protein
VQLARPVEHCVCVATRRTLRAVLVRAFVPTVTFRADSTSDVARARRLLVSVPVAVVARAAVVPDDEWRTEYIGRAEHSCACPQQVVCIDSILQPDYHRSYLLLRVDFTEPDSLDYRALRRLTAVFRLEIIREGLVQRLTVIYILIQHALLHDTVKLLRIPLLIFDARASQARRQPVSVRLRLVGLVLVGEHYVDPVARTRP